MRNAKEYLGIIGNTWECLGIASNEKEYLWISEVNLRFQEYLGMLEECFKNGVMVRFTGNTIALSPPLIIDKTQIDIVFDVLSNSIKNCFLNTSDSLQNLISQVPLKVRVHLEPIIHR